MQNVPCAFKLMGCSLSINAVSNSFQIIRISLVSLNSLHLEFISLNNRILFIHFPQTKNLPNFYYIFIFCLSLNVTLLIQKTELYEQIIFTINWVRCFESLFGDTLPQPLESKGMDQLIV